MNTFSDWLSKTILNSLRDLFFRNSFKAGFHFNRIVKYFIVFKSFVLLECLRNNEIRYVSLRYD